MRQLIALLASCCLAGATGATAADTARGRLSVDGRNYQLKHVYGFQLPRETPPPPATEDATEYARQLAGEARRRPPGHVIVLAPRPLPAQLLQPVDAFTVGRVAGYLDARPELSVWLQFNEGGSRSHGIRGNAPGKPVRSFALDWDLKPGTDSATQLAATLTTRQDEKRRQLFESAKISLEARFDTAIRPVVEPQVPATAGKATGRAMVEGRPVQLQYAYAYVAPRDELSDAGETTLLLSEIPIPEQAIRSAGRYLGEQDKLGVELDLKDPRPGSIQAVFLYRSGSYGYRGGGEGSGVVLAENGPTIVAGQAALNGKGNIALDAVFKATLLPADEPLELLQDDAAAASAYARQVEECRATLATADIPRIRRQFRSDDAEALESLLTGERGDRFAAFLRASGSAEASGQITQISVRPDAVRMTTTGDGSRSQQTVLGKENGEWRCPFNPGLAFFAVFAG